MANLKLSEAFGLDPTILSAIDWPLALARIKHDLKSDFIYAPHIGFIYRKAGEELIAQVKDDLKKGGFNPGMPITIEVPKSFRIRVAVSSKRLGPSFYRPGSILLPRDRLLYQALADQAAPIIDSKTNHERSFSHRLAPAGSASMFLPTRTCWGELQKALGEYASSKAIRYILKLDVSNFFGSINQHTLINILNDSAYPKSLSSRLELLLTSYTGDRSSRGILQGIYPSDLIGNFYMAPVDRFLEEYSAPSARYVDDIYIFVESVEAADYILRSLIPFLRSYDLVLNEAKSVIIPKAALITEEPDLQELFNKAVEEIANQVEEDDFDADYGFQTKWEDDEPDDQEEDSDKLELAATKVLFDSLGDYAGHEENIERFCLPLFAKAASNYAVDHVIDAFRRRPAMSQIYASYLSKFLSDDAIRTTLLALLSDVALTDWQKMWTLAALMQVIPSNELPIKAAFTILKDANRHEALRAVAAIYVGRYGDLSRRKSLITIYSSVSNYIQAAIYFSSRAWPAVERANVKASWSGHTPLNNLMMIAISKK